MLWQGNFPFEPKQSVGGRVHSQWLLKGCLELPMKRPDIDSKAILRGFINISLLAPKYSMFDSQS